MNPIPSHRWAQFMGKHWEFRHVPDFHDAGYEVLGIPVSFVSTRTVCRPVFSAANPYTWDRTWRDVEEA